MAYTIGDFNKAIEKVEIEKAAEIITYLYKGKLMKLAVNKKLRADIAYILLKYEKAKDFYEEALSLIPDDTFPAASSLRDECTKRLQKVLLNQKNIYTEDDKILIEETNKILEKLRKGKTL